MMWKCIFITLLSILAQSESAPDFSLRLCEPIRIDMCRGIGYNETSMPNLVGHELQTEVEFTLQTFVPLIEYVCSTQLKLFLCAAFVPMCTPKVPVPIGPCRSLCENVRSHCYPVLQGFGFPWPPALNCSRYPKENNHETMCMEGPGVAQVSIHDSETYLDNEPNSKSVPALESQFECPGPLNSHLYVKLLRSGRCALQCDADVLFGQHEKHLAEVWVTTWTYAALGLAVVATLSMILGSESRNSSNWSRMLTPLVWCHDMVVVGWAVRFVSGRNATACGYDPQYPNVSLLLVDGLSNASCAATFILRYYFGMAACVWWAILCLGWHRDVRRTSPDVNGHVGPGTTYSNTHGSKRAGSNHRTGWTKANADITHSNLACFAAWGLPAFQTAAVIVARLVDADELLGACFVGNQSDKGLQILVATPLFCFWIFGSMNLISGFLVHRRNKDIIKSCNTQQLQLQLQDSKDSGFGTFLFIYCAPCALLLLAVIYEFANIDVWLNTSIYLTAAGDAATPLWPFLTRAFMELMLCIICSAWILGPKMSTMYKQKLTPRSSNKQQPTPAAVAPMNGHPSSRSSHVAYSTVSYQTVRQSPQSNAGAGTLSLNQMSNYSLARNKCSPHLYVNRFDYKQKQSFHRYGSETIL